MPKRENYISKEDMFMAIAYIASMRSKDPNTQVGAAIVSKDGRILSTGYNGMPNGCSDDEYPWEREAESELDKKYYWVAHSELNAILNYRGDKKNLEEATIYVTLFPCHECAKAIIQSGIKTLYYDSDKYDGTDDNKASKRMLTSAGVKFEQYSLQSSIFKFQDQLPEDATSDNTPNTQQFKKISYKVDPVYVQDHQIRTYCPKCNNVCYLSSPDTPCNVTNIATCKECNHTFVITKVFT